jgi:hypothetical protein
MQTDIIFITAFAVETIVYTAAVIYIAHIIKTHKKQPNNPQQKTTKQNPDIQKLIEKLSKLEEKIQNKELAQKLQPKETSPLDPKLS